MTISEAQDTIIEEFARLPDWFAKYEYIIDLGKKHNPPDDGLKDDRHALRGCQSQVWITAEVADNRISFQADSDSIIIKGILVLLLRALNNQPPAEVAAADLYFLKEIGVSTNLSPARANGLAAIVKQLRHLGAAAGAQGR